MSCSLRGARSGAAVAAVSAVGKQAEAGVELGRYARRAGRSGQDDRRPGGGGGTGLCQGVRCVFGIPGAQTNELWDAFKARGVPYLLVANEASASVMADASARATGEVGVFSVVPGPGLTNALTGIGEALLDSIPIVGIVTDIDRSPQRTDRPGARAVQCGDSAPGRQGALRGSPPGGDPRGDLSRRFRSPGWASRARWPC